MLIRAAVADYLADCAVGLAQSTVSLYAWVLGSFLVVVGGDRDIRGLGVADLRRYFLLLVRRGYADTTRHVHYRTLRSFYGWCLVRKLTDDNPMLLVRSPRLAGPARSGVSLADVRRLLAAAAEGQNAQRDQALLVVMLDTGLRRAEVCALVWADVDWDECLLRVRRGKGGRGRRVPLSGKSIEQLRAWRGVCADGRAEGLICGLTAHGLGLLFRRLSRRSGVACTPHQLRHTFATLYRGDVEDLRLILGHANVATTASIYRHRASAQLVANHGRLSPVAGLK